jgi:protein O-mannosyl-transferase
LTTRHEALPKTMACRTTTHRYQSIDLLVSALIIVGTFVAYVPALSADDDSYVIRNEHVRTGLSWRNFVWAWTSTYQSGNWHPLTWLSLEGDASLYGARAFGFHLTNVILHAANSALLFLALFRMTRARWCSAWTAALFAWHPLHVESVAWIAERKDVLSTLFFMLSLLAYGAYAQAPSTRGKAWVVGWGAMGLASKPMLVSLPVVLLLLDYWPLGRWRKFFDTPGFWRALAVHPLVREKLPLIVLAAISSGITLYAQASSSAIISTHSIGIASRLANAGLAYWRYLGMMIWPKDLQVFYPYSYSVGSQFSGWLGLILAGVVTILIVRSGPPYLRTGWLWYVVTLLPVIGLVQAGSQAVADRYTYVPAIGIFLACAWGTAELLGTYIALATVVRLAAVAVLALALVATWVQAGYWHDSVALWGHATLVSPDNRVAHYNLGQAFMERNMDQYARVEFEKALRPDAAVAWKSTAESMAEMSLGQLAEKHMDFAAALAYFRRALVSAPDLGEVHYALGHVQEGQGRWSEAEAEYRQAIRLNPALAMAHNNLGQLLARQGKSEEAIREFTAAVVGPERYIACYNLGSAYLSDNRYEQAIRFFQDATLQKPDLAAAHNSLGVAFCLQKRYADAAQAQRRALALLPRNAKYLGDLAYALARQGTAAEAARYYQAAKAADPSWVRLTGETAWFLATSPQANQRNGPAALRLALQLNEAGPVSPWTLDILGAGWAENGDFERSRQAARQALRGLSADAGRQRSQIEEHLRSYEANQPWRERSVSAAH